MVGHRKGEAHMYTPSNHQLSIKQTFSKPDQLPKAGGCPGGPNPGVESKTKGLTATCTSVFHLAKVHLQASRGILGQKLWKSQKH